MMKISEENHRRYTAVELYRRCRVLCTYMEMKLDDGEMYSNGYMEAAEERLFIQGLLIDISQGVWAPPGA